MLDERFSRQAFDALGWDTEASRALCGELGEEVHGALVEVLKPVLRDIVEKLNSMGHSLLDVSVEMGDEMHYREPLGQERGGPFRMLLAADLIVTAGYPRSQRVDVESDAL